VREAGRLDATLQNPEQSWDHLRKTVEIYEIALFLGAGVSSPNKIPSWTEFVRNLGEWSPDEMTKFSSAGLSLISLCEIAKRNANTVEWNEKVRRSIYNGFLCGVGVTQRRGGGATWFAQPP
jgi:hypothetical protein